MYIGKETDNTTYTRISKCGKEHEYVRAKTLAVLRCDECDEIFRRELKKISPKRLSNNYFHVCENCDVKRFAQRKGVERKKIWDMPASVELPVGKY
jgi:hypothetical protein